MQDAADQLDRDAAMAGDEFPEGDEPHSGGFAGSVVESIDVTAADTDAYESVGAGSH